MVPRRFTPLAYCRRDRARTPTDVPLIGFNVFEPCPTSRAQAISRLFDTTQEPWVVFETVLEPLLFRFEADQHARGLAVACDDRSEEHTSELQSRRDRVC